MADAETEQRFGHGRITLALPLDGHCRLERQQLGFDCQELCAVPVFE